MSSRTRRRVSRLYSVEDEVLDKVVQESEARLAARQQARAEAKEIRMREIERQRQAEERGEAPPHDDSREVVSSRRSSSSGEEFPETLGSKEYKLLSEQVTELEEKFRRAMILTAQLDNEKAALAYEVDTLKDDRREMAELHLLLQKDHKALTRDHELLTNDFKDLKAECESMRECIRLRDELIADTGLVLVGADDEEDDEEEEGGAGPPRKAPKMALVTREGADILKRTAPGSLDVRLKKLAEEKQELLDEIYRMRLDVEEERHKAHKLNQLMSMRDAPEAKLIEVQREANRQMGDYKYKLKRADQEMTTLQTKVSRLEAQLNRFKALAESSESVEDELKAEKRKLQRELRDAQARAEDLETANVHLQKRIDKLKTVKSGRRV